MTAVAPRAGSPPETRLLLFEVSGTTFALPIADVLEVMEIAPIAGIPGLPRRLAGVMNHHGDALPVVSREALFEVSEANLVPARHVLVLAERGGEAGHLGVPVDDVVGLADAALGPPQLGELVAERLSLRDRVTSVLEARRLVARAAALIEMSSVPVGTR
ncbi:chemotaxis protein CheW [Myxococcota bacterium]|nr:chemotaxis protein CheW [Myxococcota bacterium]MCZ7620127.1 chemotaxis protein CheW [Myxococcota bacterium]